MYDDNNIELHLQIKQHTRRDEGNKDGMGMQFPTFPIVALPIHFYFIAMTTRNT